MKLHQLLEIVNSDIWLKGYDKECNLLIEGTRNDVKEYEEWLVNVMWTEQDVIAFHITID